MHSIYHGHLEFENQTVVSMLALVDRFSIFSTWFALLFSLAFALPTLWVVTANFWLVLEELLGCLSCRQSQWSCKKWLFEVRVLYHSNQRLSKCCLSSVHQLHGFSTEAMFILEDECPLGLESVLLVVHGNLDGVHSIPQDVVHKLLKVVHFQISQPMLCLELWCHTKPGHCFEFRRLAIRFSVGWKGSFCLVLHLSRDLTCPKRLEANWCSCVPCWWSPPTTKLAVTSPFSHSILQPSKQGTQKMGCHVQLRPLWCSQLPATSPNVRCVAKTPAIPSLCFLHATRSLSRTTVFRLSKLTSLWQPGLLLGLDLIENLFAVHLSDP